MLSIKKNMIKDIFSSRFGKLFLNIYTCFRLKSVLMTLIIALLYTIKYRLYTYYSKSIIKIFANIIKCMEIVVFYSVRKIVHNFLKCILSFIKIRIYIKINHYNIICHYKIKV